MSLRSQNHTVRSLVDLLCIAGPRIVYLVMISPLMEGALLDSPELRPLGGFNMSDNPILGSCGTGSFR